MTKEKQERLKRSIERGKVFLQCLREAIGESVKEREKNEDNSNKWEEE
jgi:hypothetical protein